MCNYRFKRAVSLFLALFMVLSTLSLVNAAYANPSGVTSGLFNSKFGRYQVFDCQRSPAYPAPGQPINYSYFINIYNANTLDSVWEQVDWGAVSDRYLQFEDSAIQGSSRFSSAYLIKLNLYEADGTFVETISDWGTVWSLEPAGFLYEGRDFFGYYFANDRTYEYGSSITYTPTSGLVTDVDDLRNYQSTVFAGPLYSFKGFSQPVDVDGTINYVRAGSSVPLKFSLNGNKGLAIFDGAPKVYDYDFDQDIVTSDSVATVTAGKSSLSYDTSADQYVWIWKTDKDWAGNGKMLVVRLNDGTEHEALFYFNK